MNGQAPGIQELAVDSTSGRLGVVMAYTAGTAWLRPPAGGLEWTVTVTSVRRATAAEALSARVAAANAKSRGER